MLGVGINGGCQGLGGEDNGKSVEIISVWEDENILQMHDGNGCQTMWMYLMPLSCTSKW